MRIDINEVPKLLGMIVVLFMVGNTISLLTSVAGKFIILFAHFSQGLFIYVGELLKRNILVFALWVLVLSKIRKISLRSLAYNSILKIINNNGECSICLEGGCDELIQECHHMYHHKCMQKWLKQSSTCPYCRLPINKPKQQVTLNLLKYLVHQRYLSVIFILFVWGFLTFKVA